MKKLILLAVTIPCFLTAETAFTDSFEAAVPVPENLRVSEAREMNLSIEWDEIKDIDQYQFYYARKSFSTLTQSYPTHSELATFAEKNGGKHLSGYYRNRYLSNLSKGTRYFIVVTAKKAKLTSKLSKELIATTDIAFPEFIRAQSLGIGTAEISWRANKDATSYNVYFANKPFVFDTQSDRHPQQLAAFVKANNGKVFTNVKATNVVIDKLTPTQPSYFVVTSRKDDVEGYASPSKNVTVRGDMNDTGVGNAEKLDENDVTDCQASVLRNQDCAYGRDATDNDANDGVAGFAFTKLDKDGKALTPDAPDWQCVKDVTTGLIWEIKTTYGKDQLYTHYDSRFGGENDLRDNRNDGGDDRVWAGVSGYYSTENYAQQLNRQKYCGIDD